MLKDTRFLFKFIYVARNRSVILKKCKISCSNVILIIPFYNSHKTNRLKISQFESKI